MLSAPLDGEAVEVCVPLRTIGNKAWKGEDDPPGEPIDVDD